MQYAVLLESSTLLRLPRLKRMTNTVYVLSHEIIRRKSSRAIRSHLASPDTQSLYLSFSLSQGYVDGRAARPAHFRSRRTAERPSRGNARVHSRPHTVRSACGTNARDRSHDRRLYHTKKATHH